MIDRDVGMATVRMCKKPRPVMPGGAAARVADLIDETANLIESLDVLGVLSEGEFDIGLFE